MQRRSAAASFLVHHRSWIVLGLTLLLVLGVRIRLRDMPLERDEGEYAYAGQLLLHGVPPYREAYNMKLPGTYAAYAVIMALFGQTPAAIHIGVALVNMASIVLMFLIGRELLDDVAGAVAAVCFALLSLSPSVLGLMGHATHFVLLPALGGVYLLVRRSVGSSERQSVGVSERLEPQEGTSERGIVGASKRLEPALPRSNAPRLYPLTTGILFGLSFLMKQHGIFFGIFGAAYLLWCALVQTVDKKVTRTGRSNRRSTPRALTLGRSHALTDLAFSLQLSAFALGFLLPYAITCLLLWLAGDFHQFWFWTVTYAGRYAAARPLVYGPDFLRAALTVVVGPNMFLWLLPWTGALVMWWDERLDGGRRFFITAFLVCSFAAVSVGFYFRPHYFILLLSALALLSGVAVSRSLHLLKQDRTIELFLAIPIIGLFVFGSLAVLIGNGSILFGDTPEEVVHQVYQSTLNSEALKAADYIKLHAARDARIAVIGSEPEIYFYAKRRSATGYIYMYPLMEPQPYAAKMQEEMIAEIERARPEYAVYVNDDFSWHRLPDSVRTLDDWWKAYWPANFDVAATFYLQEREGDTAALAPAANADGEPKYLLVLKRKTIAGPGR